MDEIYALHPFRAFSGRYNRMMVGYRMREEPFKLKWAQEDVELKIRHISDPVSRRRTRAAFDYLMNNPNCSYKSSSSCTAVTCASCGFLSSFLMNPSMALKLHYGRTSTTTTASASLFWKGRKLGRARKYLLKPKSPLPSRIMR